MTVGSELPAWARQLFRSLKITADLGVVEVFQRTEDTANQLAPNSRRLWTYLLVFQGAAVLAPLLWLSTVREQWNVFFTASIVIFCTFLVLAICWWLRWKGMQHVWARARVVAEIARSVKITARVSQNATAIALNSTPSLRVIAKWLSERLDEPSETLETRVARYSEERVKDQLDYYKDKLDEALKKRRSLSKVVTLSLDAALFFAVAGLIIAMRSESIRWLTWSNSDYVLGMVGVALPLIALLAQLQGAFMGVNRRVGKYAQQIELLQDAEIRAAKIKDEAALTKLVAEVETTLLGEVVEWFFEAELTEPYYRSRSTNQIEKEIREFRSSKQTLIGRLFAALSLSAGFLGRVIFGRLLIVSVSVILTTAFIDYRRVPEDPNIASTIRIDDGQLLSPDGGNDYKSWNPLPSHTENGFLLIAHGLRDEVDMEASGKHWMTEMEKAIREKLGTKQPDIALVDWRYSAKPTQDPINTLEIMGWDKGSMPKEAFEMLQDISTIRSYAERIGEQVGYKLARAIRKGTLHVDKPMHFIGHSAGGFVVLNVALVLQDLGLAPENLRITLLDTPLPVRSDLEKVAGEFPVDFYETSAFALGVPPDQFVPLFRRFIEPLPKDIDNYMGAHSYAYQWYIQSIKVDVQKDGFSRSPLFSGSRPSEKSIEAINQ